MNEDDRKKYLEELMQPHIPLRVLQEIRQEILVLDDADYDYEGYYKAVTDALAVIDKHIKQIEGSDTE